MKSTLVIGASPRSTKYSHMAIRTLLHAGHPVHAVGLVPGKVESVEIQTGQPIFENLDTVTLYVGPQNQPSLYDYLVKLKPKRVIFNPGTENEELYEILEKKQDRSCSRVYARDGECRDLLIPGFMFQVSG